MPPVVVNKAKSNKRVFVEACDRDTLATCHCIPMDPKSLGVLYYENVSP
jgi:hypothetical protein